MTTRNLLLLLITAASVVALIVLIARFKLPSFVALLLASLGVGLCSGAGPLDTTRSFAEGVGAVLGSIAMVIALGALLGRILAATGGAEQIALTLIRAFHERWTPWAIAFAGFIVGLPVFFGVGLVLLAPVVLTIAKQARMPVMRLGLPLVAGLSVAHGLVPPHPGPIAAVQFLKADVGKTLLYSVLIGLPTVLLCGPLLGGFLARHQKQEPEETAHSEITLTNKRSLGAVPALVIILLPVLLMLLATIAGLTLTKSNSWRSYVDFAGNPTVAMLIAVLVSLGLAVAVCKFDRHQLAKIAEESLAPVATILLVVGAGGGFSRVLVNSGAGDALANLAKECKISPLLLGWIAAALVRLATGSATVAISTASGLLAPIAAVTPGLNRELLVVSMGAGSLILSHVNDGGFWFVKEYLNLSVTQTLQTWTIIETAISLAAVVFAIILSQFL
jgi:GntP family gluconate:H+ symporter